MQAKIIPVILCGGSGIRLWPLSRQSLPKQLLKIGRYSLLQESVLRVKGAGYDAPILVCADEHEHLVQNQLAEVGISPKLIIVEPEGRNTAPAIAVAAISLIDQPDQPILVVPSDHFIRDTSAFDKAIVMGWPAAMKGHLVTLGIAPDRPYTGYGYIHGGEELTDIRGVHAVKRFVEKPNILDAQSYVMSREYYWNGGIFLFLPRIFLDELAEYRPKMAESCRLAVQSSIKSNDVMRLSLDAYRVIDGESIDYAVMEQTGRAVVVPVSMGWSDVGSWTALWEQSEKDACGNAVHGDVIAIETANSYLHSGRQLLVTLGIENLVVIVTDDAVLVAHRDHSEQVKDVVYRLKLDKRPEATGNATAHRPWGSVQTVDRVDRFHVKHIVVAPWA